MRLALRTLPLAALLALAGCAAQGEAFDPTVRVLGGGTEELGVATPYGVVFLGHRVQEAAVQLVPSFGDGPGLERSTALQVADGLFLAQSEIELVTVPLAFEAPAPGTRVQVRGRTAGGPWVEELSVAAPPNSQGLLLQNDGGLRRRIEQGMVGAGVYLEGEGGQLSLLGLVDGMLTIGDRNFIGVAGPGHLWRAAAHDRTTERTRWVYREDVL